MNSEIVSWLDSSWVKLIGLLASVISIVGIFYWNRQSKIRNKLNNVKIGGSYTGGDQGQDSPVESQKIKNELKNTSVGGDYTGGSKK
ncbi:hypothetical protein CIK05_00930 [Bdellovibrio sp. qaytius]|nr:hypothetical protein CIK05_00930 [Bdellovibrio sp. qaytius]